MAVRRDGYLPGLEADLAFFRQWRSNQLEVSC